MSTNIEVVQQIYAAIGSGDIPGVLARMTDDVEINVPGPAEIPFTGTFHGHEGVGRFFGSIAQSARIDAFEPREFIAGGDDVVVLGHEELTALGSRQSWSTDWAMVWTLTDGRVRRLREFHETDAIASTFR
jgi:hypothetical protein